MFLWLRTLCGLISKCVGLGNIAWGVVFLVKDFSYNTNSNNEINTKRWRQVDFFDYDYAIIPKL